MNCQQFELYAAEGNLPLGHTFGSRDECQAYVDALRDTPLWERQYPMVKRVEVDWKPRGDASVGRWDEANGAGVIAMLLPHRNELFVCHEVSHVLAAARYKSASHDPWFARTYLELVFAAMGTDAYQALKQAFVVGGIDHDHHSHSPAGIEL